MSRPYIGIVGVKNKDEAETAAHAITSILPKAPIAHCAQIGVQVTTRTLNGEVTESRRNPRVLEIPEIFATVKRIENSIFTVVHFTTRDPSLIFPAVCKLFELGGMYERNICRGLQLNRNFSKVSSKTIDAIKSRYPELKIILQLHKEPLESMSVKEIGEELKKFGDLLDYVLIDASGGRGEELVASACAPLARYILENTPVSVAIAGGLNPSNTYKTVMELRRYIRHSNFSVDAESGLRDRLGEGYGNDDFNPSKAKLFFREAVSGFGDELF